MKTNLTIFVIGLTALIAVASMDDDTRNNVIIKQDAAAMFRAESVEHSRTMLQSESESTSGGVVCYHVYSFGVRFPALRCFELIAGKMTEVLR